MRERCQLCGARLRAEDTACRECGTPREAPPHEGAGADDKDSPGASARISFTDIATPPSLADDPSASTSAAPVPSPRVRDEESPENPDAPPSESGDEFTATGTKIADPTRADPTRAVPTEGSRAASPAPIPAVRPAPVLQPSEDDFSGPSRSRLGLWLTAGLIVAGGVGAAMWALSDSNTETAATVAVGDEVAERPEPPSDGGDSGTNEPPPTASVTDCALLASMVGKWNFATEVTGARSVNKLGIRGYYQLEIAVDDCRGTATLSKTGFTGSNFAERNIQRATAELHHVGGALGFGFGNRFVLRDERGKGGDQQFFFSTHDGKLTGVWRQRGREWDKNRLQGILVGSRTEPADALAPTLPDLSCPARCVLACDALSQPDPAATDGHAACTTACGAEPEQPAICGARQAPSAELSLALEGPQPELAALCPPDSCEVDPKVKRGKARPVAAAEGAFREVHFVRFGGGRRGGGEIRIALRVEAGWYLSAAIAPVPADGTKDISNARLALTALGAGTPPSHVVGHFTVKGTGAFVACRLPSAAPVCIAVRELANIADASAIAGGTIAVRGEDRGSLRAW